METSNAGFVLRRGHLAACAAVALAMCLSACSGSDDAGELPPGSKSAGRSGRTPDRDLALVVFPGPRGEAPQAAAVTAAREESASEGLVLTKASDMPQVGGSTAFFQLDGDYRRCARMLPGVDYSLAWRFAPPAATRPSESVISLDVAAIAAGAPAEGAARLALELDTGTATVQRFELA